MLTPSAARDVLLTELRRLPEKKAGEWRILNERETPRAFVFAYCKFVDGKPLEMLGNVPYVVPKDGREPYPLRKAAVEYQRKGGLFHKLRRWWIRNGY